MAIKPLTLLTSPVPIVAMPAQTCETQPRPKGEMRAGVGAAIHIPQQTMMRLSQVEGFIFFRMKLEGISKRMYYSGSNTSAACPSYHCSRASRVRRARHTGVKKTNRAML